MFIVARGETKGTVFPIEPGENFIGRWDPDKGAFPEIDLDAHDPEAKISRRHALLRFENGQLFIEDIGSMNGTFVNRGARLKQGDRVALKEGDEVVVGKTFLRLERVG